MAKSAPVIPPTGMVKQVNIGQEMRDAYLDYAMSVIVARALPDARDGLKPVHRRILYAMYDMGLRADSPMRKSARIVGEVLGKYHPHGDSAVYESLVRMAQDFSMRYPLVRGQGNFGSIDGDGAAAMRYTEAKMTDMGEELLTDINMDTVNFTENFDGSLEEPTVLPSAIPNLLVNGSSGIAVGMSTNIPPHNLGEICDALAYMLSHWDTLDEVTVQDLMKFVQGPDFPTGGLVYHHDDSLSANGGADEGSLVSAYATGRGKIIMRAKLHIEDMGRGKSRIIVTEIPYQTNKSALVERIANLARDGRLEGISDLRDESDRQGLRLAIELQRGVEAEDVLKKLFQLTPLQETYSIIMLALVNGEPRILSLKQALKVYIDHRQVVVRRRSEFDLKRARDRAHILGALLKALDKLDRVIATIRKSATVEEARNGLMELLKIDEIQARAILDLQLRRLAALERQEIQDEHDEKMALIAYLEGLLGDEAMIRGVVAEELISVKRAYNDPRRTVIVDGTASNATSTMMPQEETWVTLTVDGKMARSFETTPPRITVDTKMPPRHAAASTTSDIVYLFTTGGLCTTVPVHQLPQTQTPAEGAPFRDMSALSGSETIAAMISLPPGLTDGFVCLATVNGEIKRIRLEDLPGLMANSFKAIDIDPDDQLGWVFVTGGEDTIILTTAQAQSIRFKETDVRPTTLGTGGMRGIKLSSEPLLNLQDIVIGAGVAHERGVLWTITDNGIAKVTSMEEYPIQGRAGAGVVAMKLPPDSAGLVAAVAGEADDIVLILTTKQRPKQIRLGSATRAKRAALGVSVFSLTVKEQVAAAALYQKPVVQPTPAAKPGKTSGELVAESG